jgi:ATP-binding cassette subfamily B protein
MTEDATAQGPLAFIRMRAGPYRTLFIGTLLAAVLSGALGLAPFLTIYGIVAAVDAQDATLAGAAAIAAMGVLATALHLLFAAAAVLGGHKTAFAIQRDLRLELLRRISDAPISRVEGRAGEIKKTVLGDVDRLEGLLAHVLPDIAAGLSATIAGSLILAFVDWRLFLASLCLLPVALFAQMWTYGGRTELFERWGTAEANANAALLSYVRGIATLRAFNRQASTLRNVRSAIEELRAVDQPACGAAARVAAARPGRYRQCPVRSRRHAWRGAGRATEQGGVRNADRGAIVHGRRPDSRHSWHRSAAGCGCHRIA